MRSKNYLQVPWVPDEENRRWVLELWIIDEKVYSVETHSHGQKSFTGLMRTSSGPSSMQKRHAPLFGVHPIKRMSERKGMRKKRIQYFQSIHNSFCFSVKENVISELPLSAAVFFLLSFLITFTYFSFARAIAAWLLLFQSPKSTVTIGSIIHGQWQTAVQYCFRVSGESMVFLFATSYAYWYHSNDHSVLRLRNQVCTLTV